MLKFCLSSLLRVEAAVAATAFVAAAMAIMADVVGRELLGQGIWGAAKFAVFCAVTAGFLGIGIATHAGMHLRPTFTDGWLPRSWQPALGRLGHLVTALLFFTMAWYAGQYVAETRSFGQMAPVLEFPLWMIQVLMPYAFISNGLRNLIYAISPELTPQARGVFG